MSAPEGLSERNELSLFNLFWLGFKGIWRTATFRSKGWHFSERKRSMIIWEWDEWKKYYLPINIKDFIVLDVGAGEGETAKFFLEHGAKTVICVESDKFCFDNLVLNSEVHHITPFLRKFRLSDLDLPFDFMKMDIEGYEEELLSVDVRVPCVVEVHGLQLRDKFLKNGYSVVDPLGDKYACYCYKNCAINLGKCSQ